MPPFPIASTPFFKSPSSFPNSKSEQIGEMLIGTPNPARNRRNCNKQQTIGETQSDLVSPRTNIERFLLAIAPSVPAQYSPKAYFLLDDLWESFKEWSAYGARVPLVLNEVEYVVQYYVPYLSAIQIFVEPSMEQTDLRSGKPQGHLAFQYLEHDSPFRREPLYIKIQELALSSPELKTLPSCDLLPSSWFSIAWYPIYRIPTGPAMKELEACFLTYHSLCTPLNGLQANISLPAFGLFSYKYRESMWASGSSDGPKLVKALSEAACDWLKALQVWPPDHAFFASRR